VMAQRAETFPKVATQRLQRLRGRLRQSGGLELAGAG
jgi:hypothetical protein